MLTLLGLLSPLFGIIGSLLPNIVRIFEKKQEYQYDLALIEAQTKAAVQTAQIQMDIENVKADATEGAALYAHDSAIDGGKFINALRASIRPVITYAFFTLFVSVKVAAAYTMLNKGMDVPSMLQAVWDSETMSLFSTIIAFWFGARVLEKMDSLNKNRPILNRTINIVKK